MVSVDVMEPVETGFHSSVQTVL